MTDDEADVKLYCWMAKISYRNGKRVYTHRRMEVPIPSRMQTALEALLNKSLKIKIISKAGVIVIKEDEVAIVLRPEKSFLHAKPPRQNQLQKQRLQHLRNVETQNLLKYMPAKTNFPIAHFCPQKRFHQSPEEFSNTRTC